MPKATLYYKPVPVDPQTLLVMARIDAWYLEDPAAGSRRMIDYLAQDHNSGDPAERFQCLVELDKIAAPDEV